MAGLLEPLKSKFARDTVVLQAGDIFNLGASFLASILLARMLGPSGYGVYALVIALWGILSFAGDLGLAPATITQLAEALAAKDRRGAAEYCGYFLKLSLLLGLGSTLVGLIAGPIIAGALYGQAEVGLLAGLLLADQLLGLPRNLIQISWRAQRRMSSYAVFEASRGALRLGLIGLLLGLGLGLRGVVAAELAGALICSLAAGPLFARLSRSSEAAFPTWAETLDQARKVPLKKHFTFGLKIIIDRNVGRILTSVPFLILGRFAPPADVGFLRLAWSAINLPLILLNALSNNLAARLPQLRAQGEEKAFWRVYFRTCLVGGAVSVAATGLFVLLAPWLVKVVYGAEFLPALPYIYILAVGAGLAGFFAGLGALYRTVRRMGLLLVASLTQLGLYLPISYLMIKAWGTSGGAIFISGRMLMMNIVAFIMVLLFLRTR